MDLFDIAQHFFAQFFPVDARNLHQGAVLSVKYDRPSKRGFCFSESLTERIFVEDMRDAEKSGSLFYPGIDDIAGAYCVVSIRAPYCRRR